MVAPLPVSAEDSAWISARIAAFSAEAPENPRWLESYAAEFGALPLFPDWTETVGLRPDGEFVRWSTEKEFEGTRPIEDVSWALCALVAGAKRYPELRPFLPVRGRDAVDCPCRVIPMCVSGQVGCAECGGLGWLPGADRGLRSRLASWYHRLVGGRVG